jgi:hypothetical protein
VEVWNLLGGGVAFSAQEILDRYGDRDRYVARVRACVSDLVDRRHLLEEDVDRVVKHAGALWDRSMAVS